LYNRPSEKGLATPTERGYHSPDDIFMVLVSIFHKQIPSKVDC